MNSTQESLHKPVSLESCPACNGVVSASAAVCPHCGHPVQKEREAKKRAKAKEALRAHLSEIGDETGQMVERMGKAFKKGMIVFAKVILVSMIVGIFGVFGALLNVFRAQHSTSIYAIYAFYAAAPLFVHLPLVVSSRVVFGPSTSLFIGRCCLCCMYASIASTFSQLKRLFLFVPQLPSFSRAYFICFCIIALWIIVIHLLNRGAQKITVHRQIMKNANHEVGINEEQGGKTAAALAMAFFAFATFFPNAMAGNVTSALFSQPRSNRFEDWNDWDGDGRNRAAEEGLRLQAGINNRQFEDPFGRMYSGEKHRPLDGRTYYEKMITAYRAQTSSVLLTDEAKDYYALPNRAEQIAWAKAHTCEEVESRVFRRMLPILPPRFLVSYENAELLSTLMPKGTLEIFQEGFTTDDKTLKKHFVVYMSAMMRDKIATLNDIKVLQQYEKRMLDENQWMAYLHVGDSFNDDEKTFLNHMLMAGGEPRDWWTGGTLTPELRDEFMGLPLESQRRVAPLVALNAWKRDTTLAGDALRGLVNLMGETIRDAGIGVADFVRSLCVNAKVFQENVERRVLLRMAEEGRRKDREFPSRVIFGIFSAFMFEAKPPDIPDCYMRSVNTCHISSFSGTLPHNLSTP